MKMKRCSRCNLILTIVSMLCTFSGVILYFVFPLLIDSQIKSNVELRNGTVSFEQWRNPSVPIYLQIMLFEVVNSEEVKAGSRPALRQAGPFTYREHRLKFDITFDTTNDLVAYREKKWYEFQPNMSSGSEDDEITMVNLPMLVVANQLKSWPKSITWITDKIIKLFDKGLFREYKVRDILWGYEDPFLKEAAKLASLVGKKIDDRFGLYYGKNNTDDGYYVVYMGVQNISRVGQVYKWKNATTLSFWSTSYANMLNGSEGTIFSPHIRSSDRLFVFSSDSCRSLNFVFDQATTVSGINTLRFVTPASLFANSTVNPDNIGFCIPNCLDSGLLDMRLCYPGLPAVLSQPHFYQAASHIVDGVVGMHPGPDFATLLEIEPNTGVVLHASIKLQVNAVLQPLPGFTDTTNVRFVYLPLMWFSDNAQVDDVLASELRNQLLLVLKLVSWSEIVLIIFGALGLVLALIWWIRSSCRSVGYKNLDPLQSQEDIYTKNIQKEESLRVDATMESFSKISSVQDLSDA